MAHLVHGMCNVTSRSVRVRTPCPGTQLRAGARVHRCAQPRQSLQVQAAAQAAANTVRIVIQGRNLPVTEAIRQYVDEKLSRAIQNFQHTLKHVDVKLSVRGGDTGTHGRKEQKVEVTIFTHRNGVIRVEDVEDSLYASIDLACDKVRNKLTRVKEKAIIKGKWPGRAGPHEDIEGQDFQQYLKEEHGGLAGNLDVAQLAVIALETRIYEEQQQLQQQLSELNQKYPAEVRRTKEIALDPITVDEAIESLELVGHDFYVFREMTTDTIQVVYKRNSGGYGIIVPKRRD